MRKGTNTQGTNWQVFLECHTSAIVMKGILSIEFLVYSSCMDWFPSLGGPGNKCLRKFQGELLESREKEVRPLEC